MYAIKNDKKQYLRVWNMCAETNFIAGYWQTEPPFQAVGNLESAETALSIVRANGHIAEIVPVNL